MQQGALSRILTGFVFFSATLVVAVVGYVGFGWSLLEAVYMVVITIFGVGYGEVKPLESPAQKIFTILVIVAGTTSAVYIVGGFVQMLTEGEINRALDARRKERSIASLHHHTIICGFDRMGKVLAQQLQEAEEPFAIIDPHFDPNTANADYLICPGHPTDEALLAAAGIERARALVTVLPDDATNVFITLTARELNPN